MGFNPADSGVVLPHVNSLAMGRSPLLAAELYFGKAKKSK
jgi:hypothetical protein